MSAAKVVCVVLVTVLAAVAGSDIPWARSLFSLREDIYDDFSAAPSGEEADVAEIMTVVSESFRQLLMQQKYGGREVEAADESQCQRDFAVMFNTTDDNTVFQASKGTQAADAMGKPGPYILQGNIHFTGSYDECLAIGEGWTKFCVVSLELYILKVYPLVPLYMDICVPQSCNITDLQGYVNEVNSILSLREPFAYYSLNLTTNHLDCETSKTVPYSAGAIIMIVVCALFLALSIVGSVVDCGVKNLRELLKKPEISALLQRKQHTYAFEDTERKPLLGVQTNEFDDTFAMFETPLEFITSFSIFKNVKMILSTKQPPTAITSLNGIRVLSMFWVILGHTHYWALISGVLTNPLYVLSHYTHRFSFQPITNGFFSVDSFFFLSGALVSYLTLREMEKKRGWFPVLTYYLHRYLRLTMVYAFLLFFWWHLTVHLGNGSGWNAALGEGSAGYKQCEKYWWTNLIYINNFYPWELGQECMGWTWYLANDMQFYILAPLILIPLYHFFPIGLAVSGILIAVTFVANGAIVGVNHFQANTFKEANADQSDDIYIKPYTRAAPYIVGLVLGYILYKKIRIDIHWIVNWLIYRVMWLVAAGCCFSVVYGLYSTWEKDHVTLGENVGYFMFSRFVWAIGLALIVFVCHNGHGWIVNDFLSMQLWIPLSRLTYSAYLIHPIVLTVIFASTREPFTYTDYTLVVYSVAMVVLSFGAAGVVAVFVEFPLSNLEMAVFKALGLKLRESTRHSGAGTMNDDTHGDRQNTPLASSPINDNPKA